jgi:hypothetical protein
VLGVEKEDTIGAIASPTKNPCAVPSMLCVVPIKTLNPFLKRRIHYNHEIIQGAVSKL